MNILILSENFTRGGLETQIYTYWKNLKDKHRIWFCFAHYEDTGLLDSASVYTGFHFTYGMTLAELKDDVERLTDLIREYNIDVIHVHPWFALYAAYFASALTGVRIVYTYHGTVSLNYNNSFTDQIITEEIITGGVSHVFCVGEQGLEALSSLHYDLIHASVLVNPIEPEDYPHTAPVLDGPKRWALVSRLDTDKVPAIEKLFGMLPDLDIDQLDIYGNGNSIDYLWNLAGETGKTVEFKGHTNELGTVMSENEYTGVIGLGRCTIEGLALGLPCLFIGYGKVVGLIDEAIYTQAARLNFVPEYFRDMSAEEVNIQLTNLKQNPEKIYFPRQSH